MCPHCEVSLVVTVVRLLCRLQLGCNESRCVACPGKKKKNKVRSQPLRGAPTKADGRARQLQGRAADSADSMSANSLAPGGGLNMSATGSGGCFARTGIKVARMG